MSQHRTVPVYAQIEGELTARIRSGDLRPGDQVPSEQELSAQYGVSRMTARKALGGLIAKGMIYRIQGKGTFVSTDLMGYSLNTMLSFSRTMRSLGHEVSTQVLNQEIIPASASVAERLRIRSDSNVLLVRRLRLVDSVPAAIHIAYMDARVYAPVLSYDLAAHSLLDTIEQVLGIRDAYSKDWVQAAIVRPEDRDWLAIPAGSAVLELEGVSYSETGQPTRYKRAIYRGDLFKLGVTNTNDQGFSLTPTFACLSSN